MVEHDPTSDSILLLHRLVTRHEIQIRRFISRRSGPAVLRRTTVEDLHQETVEIALESANSFVFSDDARFLGWISTIARRVIARSLRPRRREPTMVRLKRAESTGVGVPESALQAGTRTPSSVVAGAERTAALSKALQTLPPHYRLVIRLYKLEERPLAEVAARMGRSKGATGRLLRRALEALSARLATR